MGAYRMSSAEDYLPQVATNKVYLHDAEVSSGSNYSIGDGILTDEDTWVDGAGNDLYSMLGGGVTFSATDYPILATIYTTLVTPVIDAPEGSSMNVRIVGDLQ